MTRHDPVAANVRKTIEYLGLGMPNRGNGRRGDVIALVASLCRSGSAFMDDVPSSWASIARHLGCTPKVVRHWCPSRARGRGFGVLRDAWAAMLLGSKEPCPEHWRDSAIRELRECRDREAAGLRNAKEVR